MKTDLTLRQRVLADLAAGHSPRQIAGRLGAESADPAIAIAKDSPHGRTVSHDAIAEEINEITRKILGWLTPREAYERLLTPPVASTN